MAYLTKLPSKRWRAQIERHGVRASATFDTKAEASAWGVREEAAILASKRGLYPRKTLADAFARYRREVSAKKEGARAEGLRFDALEREFPKLCAMVISEVATPDLVEWRQARLRLVTSGSVRRDATLIRNVFSVARDEWKWLGESPFKGFKVPSDNPPRHNRVPPRHVRAICRWLGYRTGQVRSKQQEVALAFLLALRTAMRSGELLALSDATVDLDKRVATLPHKMQYLTGRPREVPLTKHAVRLLRPMMGRGKVFTVSDTSRDALFRKACKALLIDDLHFHDARAEALTRLAQKVDVLTLAKISGHKDLKQLLGTYYRETAQEIAARL
jgi:integrase